MNLVVRQKLYSNKDIDKLDDLIYKSIKLNSIIYVRNAMNCNIIPDTDYVVSLD